MTRAAVVALGKIGLPLAVQMARRGVETVGADIDGRVVASVNAGVPPFPGEPHLAEYLADVVGNGRLHATTSTEEAVATSDVVIVVVPLIVDDSGTPDFRSIDAATHAIGRGLRPGTLVCFETTVPVGTTRKRFGPILGEASGLTPGADFALAYSPERVFSGRIFSDLRRYPKVVGGVDAASAAAATAFYEEILEFDPRPDLDRPNGVWNLGSTEAAEFTKLAETTYRDVNIALANEFAGYAESLGLDVWQIIAAANSQPFSHIHSPGIAVGGHCIPVYPRFYLAGDTNARLPGIARSVNETGPVRAVARVSDALGGLDGATVVALGATYRGDVKETAFSGVYPLVAEIERLGGTALVHDPMYAAAELEALSLTPTELGTRCDAAILQADHTGYTTLAPSDLPGCRVIFDGRNVLDRAVWEAAGIRYLRTG
jgi:nucleotide sugar dehydrogenase